jgi:hypothetical protein
MPEQAEPSKKPAIALLFLLFLEKCRNLSWKVKIIILAIIIIPVLVFFIIRGVFLGRSPLLVVTDASFKTLYGSERLSKIETRLSNRLFRRVIPVYVDENAWSDQISLAAQDAFQKPLAVLFPYRYMGGGNNYKENNPDTPVYIITGRNQTSRAKEVVSYIRTDMKTDYYRAGLCAALIAGEGNIFFISDGTVQYELREIFIEGLRAQDYTKDPFWVRDNTDFLSNSDLACAVIAGPAGEFFEQRPDTPVILFSWVDPDFTPRSVKVIFDDSPYVLALKEYKLFSAPGEEDEVFISSVPTVLKDRIEKKDDYQKLESLVKMEYQPVPP